MLNPAAFGSAAQQYLTGPRPSSPPQTATSTGATPPAPPAATVAHPAPPKPAPPNPLSQLGFLRGLLPPSEPAPLPAGSTDPAYLAYQRALNYQQTIAEGTAQRQLAALRGQMIIGPQQLAEQGVISRRNISGGAESRGIFRSGERLQNLADERTAEAQRLAALRLSASQRFGDILSQEQQTLAAIANQRADQALAGEVRNIVPGSGA